MKRDREVPVRIIVRKKRVHGEHHGGAWKVAFADFMTAMFALFLVLWLVSQSTDIRTAIAGYFQDPLGRADEFGSSIVPGEGTQAATVRPLSPEDVSDLRSHRLDHLEEKIQEKLDRSPELASVRSFIDLRLTSEGLQVELVESGTGVFFEMGRPAPSIYGVRVLEMLGSELASLPFRLRIEGHTDAYQYPDTSTYTNWELSADRANAARRILRSSGLDEKQVLEVRSLAETQPRDPQNPYATSNRRITITILPASEGIRSVAVPPSVRREARR